MCAPEVHDSTPGRRGVVSCNCSAAGKPANSHLIRVDTVPGTVSRYSGGGFVVLPQLMIDAAVEAYRADGQPLPLFAIEFAEILCGQIQPRARRRDDKTDAHAPDRA